MSKENQDYSKIPIPVDPLPPLPENILKRRTNVKTERHPLGTIQAPANLERTVTKRKVVKVLRRSNSAVNKVDTRHVTVRQNSDDLDWNFKVFKDTPDDDNNEGTLKNQNNDRAVDKERVSTPALKSLLEPSRVRNIKRSLKRPHSRELQGISPTVSDDKGEGKHRRRLEFTDRFRDKWQPNDMWLNSYATCLNATYGQDLTDYLLAKEVLQKPPKISNSSRACIMNWLVKVNRDSHVLFSIPKVHNVPLEDFTIELSHTSGQSGNPAAVQTAAWFFDTLLTVTHVTVEKLQVLAAACYWIALKIQGNVISSKTLVKAAGNAFSVELLIFAESAVMEKLKFPIQPIVAQDFIAYMSWVCDASNFVEIEAAATLLYMAGLVVNKDLCLHYPSLLAAAAIRNALRVLKKKELLAKLEKNYVYKTASQKESNFDVLCTLQWQALRRMSSSDYEYKALLENSQDRIFTQKILTSVIF